MNVPALRFPEFAGEWEEKRIQEFLDSGILLGHLDGNHGELYPSSDEFALEGVPYVSANDLIGGTVDFSRSKRLPQERADQFKKGIAKTGDVLFAHNATVGPTAILRTNLDFVILSTTVTYYRFDNELYDIVFAFFALNSDRFVRQYSRVMSQSTRNQVPITMQRKFWLPVPTLPEQKKIGAFLGVVDEKLAALRARRAGLETYKRGLMQKLFSRTLRFTKPDGSAFPDWEEKRLGDVASIVGGGTPDTGIPEYWTGDITWFTPSEIKRKYLSGSVRKISEAGLKASSAKMLPSGALILSTRATVGDVGIATEPCATNQGFQSLIVNDGNLNEFWYYWLKNNKKLLLRRASGSTFLEIGKSEVEKLPIEVPHLDEQALIADALQAMEAKIAAVGDQIARMEAFKKGLLQQMFV